eukprot:3543664-Rhodomonas_salina.1
MGRAMALPPGYQKGTRVPGYPGTFPNTGNIATFSTAHAMPREVGEEAKRRKDSGSRGSGSRWEEEEYEENDDCDDDNDDEEEHDPLEPEEKKFHLPRLTTKLEEQHIRDAAAVARMLLDRCTRAEVAEAMRSRRTRNDMIATWWTPKKKQGTEANQKAARFSRTPTLRESTEWILEIVGILVEEEAKQRFVASMLPDEHLQVEQIFKDEGSWDGAEFLCKTDWERVSEELNSIKTDKGKPKGRERKTPERRKQGWANKAGEETPESKEDRETKSFKDECAAAMAREKEASYELAKEFNAFEMKPEEAKQHTVKDHTAGQAARTALTFLQDNSRQKELLMGMSDFNLCKLVKQLPMIEEIQLEEWETDSDVEGV